MVARNDRDVFDAALAQAANDTAHLGPYRRAQFDGTAERVVDRDHDQGVAFAMGLVERRFDLSRQRDTLRLHEAPAADAHPMPVDADRDPIADLVLGRIGRRQMEALLLRLVQDGERDRMMKSPFRGCGEAQQLRRTEAVGGDHPPDLGPFPRQCAGLVEQHGVDLAQEVECPPVLDEDAFLRAERQCRQHRQRRRHADAGPEVAVDDRHRSRRAQRRKGETTQTKGRDHRLVGELLALVLRSEFVTGAVVQDLGDLRGGGLTAGFLDRDLDLAGDHDR